MNEPIDGSFFHLFNISARNIPLYITRGRPDLRCWSPVYGIAYTKCIQEHKRSVVDEMKLMRQLCWRYAPSVPSTAHCGHSKNSPSCGDTGKHDMCELIVRQMLTPYVLPSRW